MGLSKHTDVNSSLLQELEQLDTKLIVLGKQMVKPSQCYRLSGNPPSVIYNTNCPEDLKTRVEEILAVYHPTRKHAADFYSVEFDAEDIHYTGRLTPEFKKGVSDEPSSWHVVLNEVFFGYLHKENDHWNVSEQRPEALVKKLGKLIDEHVYDPRAV